MFGLDGPYTDYEDAMADMRFWYTMQEAFGLALTKYFPYEDNEFYAETVQLFGSPGDAVWYPAFQVFHACLYALGLELSDIGLTQDDMKFIRQRQKKQKDFYCYPYWRETREGERLFFLARSCFGSAWCYEFLP